MIVHSVKVLPPRRGNNKISIILVNGTNVGYNYVKRFVKVNKKDVLIFQIMIMDMDSMQTTLVDYPNLYFEALVYEDSTKDYNKKFLKFKNNVIIIESKMFKSEEIKIKVLLKDNEEVIDYCLIDIV